MNHKLKANQIITLLRDPRNWHARRYLRDYSAMYVRYDPSSEFRILGAGQGVGKWREGPARLKGTNITEQAFQAKLRELAKRGLCCSECARDYVHMYSSHSGCVLQELIATPWQPFRSDEHMTRHPKFSYHHEQAALILGGLLVSRMEAVV